MTFVPWWCLAPQQFIRCACPDVSFAPSPMGVRGWNLGVQLQDTVCDDDRVALRGFLDYLVSGE